MTASRKKAEGPSVLESYDADQGKLQLFAQKLEGLLNDILADRGIRVHSVTSRVKSRESLERKLRKPGTQYASLGDVTDVVGLRVTTYLADDVDRVGRIMEEEFTIDRANSTDKRAIIDPDRFGYLSLHYVIALGESRSQLTEYRRFPNTKAEIQIRSILQHAWAEIEHDLGYKAGEVPRTIRRRFSRLAGLLELADQEFCTIRNELRNYERVVFEQIAASPTAVPVDKVSMEVFTAQAEIVRKLDDAIASVRSQRVGEESYVGRYADHLRSFGVHTIDDLQRSLESHESTIRRFAKSWLNDRTNQNDDEPLDETIVGGISIFYLLYILAAETHDRERIRNYLEEATIAVDTDRDELTDRILAHYGAGTEGSV